MYKKIVACVLTLTMMLSVSPVLAKQKSETVKSGTVNSITNEYKKATLKTNAKLSASISNKSAYKSITEAGTTARKQVYDHKGTVVVKLKSKSAEYQKVFESLEKVIYAETASPNQGDFMKWDVDETETEFSAKKSGSYYYYTFTMHIDYLTTLSERKKLDAKVDEVISSFKFTNKTSTYNKIKKVYDYVCENVSYAKSSSNEKVYSAYSALINKKAVCQGYATLIYKMYRTLGISTRVIAGNSSFSGDNHGWNIVKLGSYFYNIDATWDSTLKHANKSYNYFLKGNSFKGHTRWSEYNTYSFYYNYPMAAKAYSSKVVAKACSKTKIANFKNKKPKFKSVSRKKVVFKKIKNATYQFKYSGVNNFKKKYTITVNTKKTKYKLKKLRKGVTYWVKFRARKKIGSKKYYSKWSAKKTI